MSTETKSLAAKITNGAWKAKRLRDNGGAPYATLYEAHIDLGVCMVWAPIGNEEQEANAELIAEAGTVANECGLSPRQLLERLMEARELLVMVTASDTFTRMPMIAASYVNKAKDTLTLPADEH